MAPEILDNHDDIYDVPELGNRFCRHGFVSTEKAIIIIIHKCGVS